MMSLKFGDVNPFEVIQVGDIKPGMRVSTLLSTATMSWIDGVVSDVKYDGMSVHIRFDEYTSYTRTQPDSAKYRTVSSPSVGGTTYVYHYESMLSFTGADDWTATCDDNGFMHYEPKNIIQPKTLEVGDQIEYIESFHVDGEGYVKCVVSAMIDSVPVFHPNYTTSVSFRDVEVTRKDGKPYVGRIPTAEGFGFNQRVVLISHVEMDSDPGDAGFVESARQPEEVVAVEDLMPGDEIRFTHRAEIISGTVYELGHDMDAPRNKIMLGLTDESGVTKFYPVMPVDEVIRLVGSR